MNISHCHVCPSRPCIHDWQSQAEHLARSIASVRDLCGEVGNAVDEQSWPEIPNAAVKMIAAMVLRALDEHSVDEQG